MAKFSAVRRECQFLKGEQTLPNEKPYPQWATHQLVEEHGRLDQLVDDASGHVVSMTPAEYAEYHRNKDARCRVLSELMARVRDPAARDYIIARGDRVEQNFSPVNPGGMGAAMYPSRRSLAAD